MVLLIVPILCFLILAFISGVFMEYERTQFASLTGRLRHLDLILLIHLKGKGGLKRFTMRLDRRLPIIEVSVRGARLKIELQLSSESLRGKTSKFEEAFTGLFDVQHKTDEKSNVIKLVAFCYIDEPEISNKLQSLFMKLHDVGANRKVIYSLKPHKSDWRSINYHWPTIERGEFYGPVHVPSASLKATELRESSGCIPVLVSAFLLPIPFVVTFYWFGIWPAMVVATAVTISSFVFSRFNNTQSNWKLGLLSLLIIAGTTSASFLTGSHTPFLMIPTIFCIVGSLYVLSKLVLGKSVFEDSDLNLNRVGNFMSNVFILLTLALGIAFNEYLRAQGELATWVWYYSYLRLELLLGAFLSQIPVIFGAHYGYFEKDYAADDSSI